MTRQPSFFSSVSFSPPSCLSRMVWSFGTLPNGLSPLLTFAPSFACVLHVLIERDSRPDTREARGHPNRLFSPLSLDCCAIENRNPLSFTKDSILFSDTREDKRKRKKRLAVFSTISLWLARVDGWRINSGGKSSRFLFVPSFSISSS